VTAAVERITRDDLPPDEMLIEVAFSCSTKTSLASQGIPEL